MRFEACILSKSESDIVIGYKKFDGWFQHNWTEFNSKLNNEHGNTQRKIHKFNPDFYSATFLRTTCSVTLSYPPKTKYYKNYKMAMPSYFIMPKIN